MPSPSRRFPWTAWISALLLGGFLAVFVRTAWVCDDAFITFRSIEQTWAGNGPRWNPHERVQVFTHPAWFLALLLARAAGPDLFLSSLILSALCSVTALLLAGQRLLPRAPAAQAAALAALLTSRAFVDFSSSGLEMPLVMLLVTTLFVLVLDPRAGEGDNPNPGPASSGRLAAVWACVAGLALCRPDLFLLAAPAAILFTARARSGLRTRSGGWLGRGLPSGAERSEHPMGSGPDRTRREGERGVPRPLGPILAGLAPLIAWGVFALVYYGFPLPNTVYAKLSTGIPLAERAAQGLRYLGVTARWDPTTAIVLMGGFAAVLVGDRGRFRDQRSAVRLALLGGVALHLAAVVAAGGDFMAGRLLLPGFLVAFLLLLDLLRRRHALQTPSRRTVTLLLVFVVTVVTLGAWGADSPWRGGTRHPVTQRWAFARAHGIADERGFWYSRLGLLPYLENDRRLPAPRRAKAPGRVEVAFSVGLRGWSAPLDAVIVDSYGLGDPLLARLPSYRPWRIGHFARGLPAGYAETLEAGAGAPNRISDPAVHRLYDDLRQATQAPLTASGRWQAIARLNLQPPRFRCLDPGCRSVTGR